MAIGCINGVDALSGFSYKKVYGHFAGTKKVAIDIKVTVSQDSIVYC